MHLVAGVSRQGSEAGLQRAERCEVDVQPGESDDLWQGSQSQDQVAIAAAQIEQGSCAGLRDGPDHGLHPVAMQGCRHAPGLCIRATSLAGMVQDQPCACAICLNVVAR